MAHAGRAHNRARAFTPPTFSLSTCLLCILEFDGVSGGYPLLAFLHLELHVIEVLMAHLVLVVSVDSFVSIGCLGSFSQQVMACSNGICLEQLVLLDMDNVIVWSVIGVDSE